MGKAQPWIRQRPYWLFAWVCAWVLTPDTWHIAQEQKWRVTEYGMPPYPVLRVRTWCPGWGMARSPNLEDCAWPRWSGMCHSMGSQDFSWFSFQVSTYPWVKLSPLRAVCKRAKGRKQLITGVKFGFLFK